MSTAQITKGRRLLRYTIAFYRRASVAGEPGEWYDEIRYDSHERRRGRAVSAPHLHIKIGGALKQDLDAAVAEIRSFIDNNLEGIEQMAHGKYRPGAPDIEDVSEI